MPVTIQTLLQGDTNYIGKHNSNYQNIKALLDALEAHVGVVLGSPVGDNSIDVGSTLFGEARALVGGTSFEPYPAGGAMLNIRPGFLWDYDNRQVVRSSVAQQFNFSSSSPGTYYIHINANGGASVNQTHADSVWSVEWSGSAFDSIMVRLPISWSYTDWQLAQFSMTRLKNFNTLVDRLEEIEQVIFPPVYDVASTYPGLLGAGDVVLRYPFPRKVEFPTGLTDSRAVAGIAPTGTATFSLRRNNVQVGTLTFSGGSTTGSFSMAGPTLFSPGQVLTVVAPNPANSTLADVGFCLAGYRVLE